MLRHRHALISLAVAICFHVQTRSLNNQYYVDMTVWPRPVRSGTRETLFRPHGCGGGLDSCVCWQHKWYPLFRLNSLPAKRPTTYSLAVESLEGCLL